MKRCDVAVIGYGPTGMMLAALLGQRGYNVIVLERHEGLYNLPRAACFDDEAMRTFQKLGLVDDISKGASIQEGYEWVNGRGEILVDFKYDNPAPGGWAALYMMFQPHIEAVLDRHDKALPSVEVRQGFTVTAIDQDDAGLTIHGADPEGRAHSIAARYAVGADGGNGFTRRTFGQNVDDYNFQENWLVCDFALTTDVDLPTFRQVCDPVQPTSIVNIGPGHHRFSFMLAPGETAEQVTRPEAIWTRVSAYLTPDQATLIRAANYTFRSRIVEQWRHGRLLLAGDAAHEMPPFLAQGMCSGIRDSHNLAWKLDLILSGAAEATILDTYQAEREPHVRAITEIAIELGRVQTLRDPAKAQERDQRLLAKRKANQGPDKLRYPGLTGGLISTHGGSFFPQGRVGSDSRQGLFDDFAGAGWRILTKDASLLDALSDGDLAFWSSIGGQSFVVNEDLRAGTLHDLDGTYAAWFAHHDCAAVIVRPDWYVYATARHGAGLRAALTELAAGLGRSPSSAAA